MKTETTTRLPTMRRVWTTESLDMLGLAALLVLMSDLGESIPREVWSLVAATGLVFLGVRVICAVVHRFRSEIWFLIVFILPLLILWASLSRIDY